MWWWCTWTTYMWTVHDWTMHFDWHTKNTPRGPPVEVSTGCLSSPGGEGLLLILANRERLRQKDGGTFFSLQLYFTSQSIWKGREICLWKTETRNWGPVIVETKEKRKLLPFWNEFYIYDDKRVLRPPVEFLLEETCIQSFFPKKTTLMYPKPHDKSLRKQESFGQHRCIVFFV